MIHLQIYGGLFEEPVRHSGSQLDTKLEHTQFRFASLETLSSKSTNSQTIFERFIHNPPPVASTAPQRLLSSNTSGIV